MLCMTLFFLKITVIGAKKAKKCRQADISHPKTSLHSEVETIRSRWSQIGKFYRRIELVETLGLPTSRRQNRGLKF